MDVIRRTSQKVDRKILLDYMIKCGIVHPDYTGKVVLSFTDGGINFIEKTEKVQ